MPISIYQLRVFDGRCYEVASDEPDEYALQPSTLFATLASAKAAALVIARELRAYDPPSELVWLRDGDDLFCHLPVLQCDETADVPLLDEDGEGEECTLFLQITTTSVLP